MKNQFNKEEIDFEKITPPSLSTLEMYCAEMLDEANRANGVNRIKNAFRKGNGLLLNIRKLEGKIMEMTAQMERYLEMPDGEVDFREKFAKVAKRLHKYGDSVSVKKERGEYVWPAANYSETLREIEERERANDTDTDTIPERRTRGARTATCHGLSLKMLTEEKPSNRTSL